MTIKTSEIKEFLQASRYINNSRKILPVLDYIKWEGNTLTKSNLNSFCVMQIESVATEPVLLDESALKSVIIGAGEEISVTVNGDEISLKAAKKPVKFQTSPSEHFPITPEQIGNPVTLTRDIIGHIKYASMFTSKDDNGEKFRHVHIIDGVLFGTNAIIFYCANIPEAIPNFIITDEALPIVSSLGECEYVSGERNDFYTAGNVTYIFIKTEAKTPAIVKDYIAEWNNVPEGFMIQKNEFVDFIESVMILNQDLDPVITMAQNHEGINLEYSGMNSKSTEEKIWCSGNMDHEFTFNPKVAGNVLKNYPSELMNGKQLYNEQTEAVTMIFSNNQNNSLITIQHIKR